MDPIAHTLLGAGIARSTRRGAAPLAMATCLLGANLPDIDVLSYLAGPVFPLAFRRGWTHGLLALAVLPVLLAGTMMAFDRLRRRRHPDATPADAGTLMLFAAVTVMTHPLLDLLNVYGIRLLMPFAPGWFYGDVLFIADPWLWAMLATGVWFARRRAPSGGIRRARMALAVAGGYILLMAASGVAARWVVWRSLPFAEAGVERVMVAPEPVTPFRKWVVVDAGDHYRVGEFHWLRSPPVRYGDLVAVPKGTDRPEVVAAGSTDAGGWFLEWARFTFARVESANGSSTRVHLIDARYTVAPQARFGTVTVEVPAP